MKKTLKILMIDDEEEFLSTMTRRMERRGHTTRHATTCAAGIKILGEWTPDAMILDVKLPDMDGLECLREIKHRWPQLPVILLTGHASVRAGVEGVAYGASDYCLKPVEFEHLIERIEIAIEEAKT